LLPGFVDSLAAGRRSALLCIQRYSGPGTYYADARPNGNEAGDGHLGLAG